MSEFGKAEYEAVKAAVVRVWRANHGRLPADQLEECVARVMLKVYERWTVRAKKGGMETIEDVANFAFQYARGVVHDLWREQSSTEATESIEEFEFEGNFARFDGTKTSPPMSPRHDVVSSERKFDEDDCTDLHDASGGAAKFWRRVRAIYASKLVLALSGNAPGRRQGFSWTSDGEEWGKMVEDASWLPQDVLAPGTATRTDLVRAWIRPVFLKLNACEDGKPRCLTVAELTWLSLAVGNRPNIRVRSHLDVPRRKTKKRARPTTPRDVYAKEYKVIEQLVIRVRRGMIRRAKKEGGS